MLRTLGRNGVRDMEVQACDAAQLIAELLAEAGVSVLNDVVLNQVLAECIIDCAHQVRSRLMGEQ